MVQSKLEAASASRNQLNRNSSRFRLRDSWLLAIAVVGGLFLSGCGGGSRSKLIDAVPIRVTASASSTTVDGSNSITLTATVSNDSKAAGVSWSLSGVGALSAQNTSSVIYTAPAPPANAATATVTATSVSDASKSSAVVITIPAKLALTTTSLAAGNVGSTYSAQLSASGGISTYAWSLGSGSLPSCMTFSSSGLLSSSSGLTASCAGTFALTFKVTDSGKATPLTDTASMSLVVNAAPVITFTGSMPTVANTGTSYTGSAAASGGVGTLIYSIVSGSLPSGLTLNASTGAITGSASAAGTFNFTVKAADAYGDSSTKSYQISVTAPSQLAFNATSLPATGTTGAPYSGTITASGGSGNYSWQVTGLPSDNLSASSSGNTLTITGTPASAATVAFTVKLTDTTTSASVSQGYTITISATTSLSLPAPNPSSLPDGIVGQSYRGAITVSGGTAPYSWTIDGLPVTLSGLLLSNGLAAFSAGGSTIAITGSPWTTSSVVLTNVTVTDSANAHATQTYTIAVHGVPGVTGFIGLTNSCSSTPIPLPQITVSINTTPQQNTTLDSMGEFSFANVPDGTWTITPGLAPPPYGPSSVLYPASTDVVVTNGTSTPLRFGVQLGYTLSGTVTYSGNATGQIYLNLVNTYCRNGGVGTSISGPGDFTIHGVPPGSYTIEAWMDPSALGNQALNLADPTGSSSVLSVSTADLSGATVTLNDPTVAAQSAGPRLMSLAPHNSGVTIGFDGTSVTDTSRREVFASYTVQWSNNTSFSSPSSATLKAVGTNKADGRNRTISSSKNLWILANGNSGMSGSFNTGSSYYFRVRGTNSAGDSNWVYWGGTGVACGISTCAVAVKVGEPAGNTYATVSGSVTFTSETSPDQPGPLYVGYYDKSTNSAYLNVIASPVVSPLVNYFTVSVPKSATTQYTPFGMLDQNKDGLIDANDVTTISDDIAPVTINGNLTGETVELPYVYLDPLVPVRFIQKHFLNNGAVITPSGYYLEFEVLPVNKMPVAVQLIAGPNVVTPMDLGSYCQGCPQFFNAVDLDRATPKLDDFYAYHVTFSDGSDMYLGAQPFSWADTGTMTGPGSAVSNMTPVGNVPGQTQPTFSWTYPANTSRIHYTFDVCCGDIGNIWDVPSYSSDSLGFTASDIPAPLVWGVDPMDTRNLPIPSILIPGHSYSWEINAIDTVGNSVSSQAVFIP